jgi:Protein of unknown function (DUF4035)
MEYDRTCPIGDVRGDWQAASIAAAVANVLVAVNGGRKRFAVADFKLEFGESKKRPKEGKSWQEMRMLAQIMAASSVEAPKKGKRRR